MDTNLEVYETVKKWQTKLEAKSNSMNFDKSSTKRAGLFWLEKYLKFLLGMDGRPSNPDSLVAERNEQVSSTNIQVKRIQEEYFEEWIVQLRREEYSSNSIAQATGLVRSFYKHNHLPLTEVTPIRPRKVRAFKIPTLKDLKKMCEHADPSLKTFILCAKDSGIPTSDLLSLSLNNLSSEFGTIKTQLKKGIIPVHIQLTRGKNQERIDTFFGSNAIEALKQYAKLNGGAGGRIFKSPNDPRKPMSIRSIEQQVKSLAIKAKVATKDVPVTPYCFRRMFNTYMKLAGVNESIVERMMGHSIGRVRSAYLVTGGEGNMEGIPISKLAQVYKDAYPAIDINNA